MLLLAAFTTVLMVLASSSAATAAPCRGSGAVKLSCQPIPEDGSWRDQIVHKAGPLFPESVLVEGNAAEVANPDGLRGEGASVTTLTTSREHSTSLILDLGRVAMGRVEIGIENAEGATIRAAYGEFRQRLGVEGDGMGEGVFPLGTDAHPWSRVDLFDPPSRRTTLKSPGKRETRYILLTLDGPGEVTIDYVRLRQTIYPVSYDGYFLSNDDLLNRAWYHSAYTGDLATVTEESSLDGAPDGPSPWMLTVNYDRVLFMGDLHMQALAGFNQSSDYWHLFRNTLNAYSCVQNPNGSFPSASSHLTNCKPGDAGPADGWRWPEEGPDPDLAVGVVFGYSIVHDFTIDSFTPSWVAGLADYYRYTGDSEFVRPLLPVARRAIEFFRSRTTVDGLFYEPEDQRTDPNADVPWVANWSPGDTATGVDSFTNAIWYDAMKGLALLEAEVADRSSEAVALRKEAKNLRRSLLKHFWDPDAGAMVLNDEDPLRDHTGDANAGNLMFRTLDEERAEKAIRFLETTLATSHGTKSSEYSDNPYRWGNMQGYINAMDALGRVRNGDAQSAVDLIRGWWGHMLANGPGTGWFDWEVDGSLASSFANSSWTTAVPALSGLLGITPVAPGFERWAVKPQVADLAWAQGRVPIPGGKLDVRWRRTGSDGFVLTVRSPEAGKRGEVAVPLLGGKRRIAMDGRIVWNGKRPARGVRAEQVGDAVVFSGLSGTHTFAWGQLAS